MIVTDKDSVAAIEMLIGGRVGLKRDTQTLLFDEGTVIDRGTGAPVVQKSKGLWMKFGKQDQPLTIQTRGGVMGIRDPSH